MIYYWLVISIPVIFSCIRIDSYKHLNLFFWFSFSFFLIFFLGFRYEVGGDWGIYKMNFHNTGVDFDFSYFNLRSDYLFEFLSWQLYFLGFNFNVLNLVCSIIFVYAITSFCTLQKEPWLALVIAIPYLIFVVSIGYVRQGTAIAFVILAYINIINKHQFKFIFYITIAVLFHKSSILVVAPLLFLDKKLISIKNIFLLIIFLSFLFLFEGEIRYLIKSYLGEGRFTKYYDPSSGVYVRSLMNVIPAVICIFYGKYLSDNYIEKRLFFIFSLLSIVSIFFAFHYPTFVDRILLYISVIQIYVFSRLFLLFRNNLYIFLTNIFVIIYYLIVLFVWLNFATYSKWWIPYQYKIDLFL